MKYFLLFFIIFILSCQKEEANAFVDECPTCTATVVANGMSWPAKPFLAWFQIKTHPDTLFKIEMVQTDPAHDKYADALLLTNIPFEVGEYKIDASLHDSLGTTASLFVMDAGYDIPNDIYDPIQNGTSIITVDSINKVTGEFSLHFEILLFPAGNLNGIIHNTSYPALIRMTGEAKGVLTGER